MDAPHAVAFEEVARQLTSEPERGLSEEEAQARLARFGPNRLERAGRPAYPAIAARQFADPLVGLLIAAAAVSLLIGEGVEAAAIGAIVLLNAVLGFVQEAGAERAVLATLEGGCSAPIGALAEIVEGEDSEEIWVRAVALSPDGALSVRMSASGDPSDAIGVGTRLAKEMLADGAAELTMDTATAADKRQNA